MGNSLFFGVMISVAAYEMGVLLKRKFKLAIFNPLLIAIAVIVVLHKWKENVLLSIGTGTVVYMLLVQLVF